MLWVWVYLAIAVAGLLMVGCFAFWLWRKAAVLFDEAGVLLDRADQLAGLLAEIGQPEPMETDPVELGSAPRSAT